ncbi:glycosyltransferase family 4 protein [Algoriphagus pacificus]|nr:glycosyltransferase family 4 protein [Algoriphagus pacificus]
MYPNSKYPSFGVFVKNFEEAIRKEGVEIVESSLIKGRKAGLARIWAYLVFFVEVIWKSNRGDFDLIYVHYMQHSLIPLNFWKRRKDKKLVLNAHGTDILGTGKLASKIRRFNSKLIKSADLVVVPSEFFVSKIKNLGVSKEKIYISPSGGINDQVFYPILPKKTDSGKIGYFGRLDPGKGLETLLKAFIEIQKSISLKLDIIGGGSLENSLHSFCQENNLLESVQFFGPLSQANSAKIIRNWDLAVFPSQLEESLGLVGIEAMACGVPVIGSRIGGIPTYLRDGINGFLFEQGNHNELVEKIVEYYQLGEDERSIMAENAVKTSQAYRSNKVTNELIEKLKSLN